MSIYHYKINKQFHNTNYSKKNYGKCPVLAMLSYISKLYYIKKKIIKFKYLLEFRECTFWSHM